MAHTCTYWHQRVVRRYGASDSSSASLSINRCAGNSGAHGLPSKRIVDTAFFEQLLDARQTLHARPGELFEGQSVPLENGEHFAGTALDGPLGPESNSFRKLVTVHFVITEVWTYLSGKRHAAFRHDPLNDVRNVPNTIVLG